MKYLYSLVSILTLVVLQIISAKLLSTTREATRDGTWFADYRAVAKKTMELPHSNHGLDETSILPGSETPYGLHYNKADNSWTLYATVLQLKTTSVYGRLGEIAQIEYSVDGQKFRNGWIVLKVDDYSFVDGASQVITIETGQNVQLYISGAYVSSSGVDWEECPHDDTYCIYASFVEGGFPKSEDYDGLTLSPSNTIIRSGFVPNDWINGMLAWKVKS